MSNIREGRWDCPTCKNKGNLGSRKFCDGCGTARGEEVKFYLPEDEPLVTDTEKLKAAKAGPDWECSRCAGNNSALLTECSGCGASRLLSEDKTPEPKPVPPKAEYYPRETPTGRSTSWLIWAAGALVAFVIGYLLIHTTQKSLVLDELSWKRAVTIEKWKPVVEEGWEVPSGGVTLRTESKIRDYKDELVGYDSEDVSELVTVGTREYKCGSKDLKNGYIEDVMCSEPVKELKTRKEKKPVYVKKPIYDDWYTYRIYRWLFEREEVARQSDQNPFWPAVRLKRDERRGAEIEEYKAKFIDSKGKVYENNFPEREWRSLKKSEKYVGNFNGFGMFVGLKGK